MDFERLVFICYPKCTTCGKAKAWLEQKGIDYESRDIKAQNPTAEELSHWQQLSQVPLKRFFNTSGLLYRELGLKDKLDQMSRQEQLELLASDGMLVKRPIALWRGMVKIGFKEADWQELCQ